MTGLVATFRFLMNKEDTKQAFIVYDAWDGPRNERNFQYLSRTEAGRRLIEDEVDFAEFLKNRDRFRDMPAGSVGRAYYDFTHSENFSVHDLICAEQRSGVRLLDMEPNRRRFIRSATALHDVLHVLTGYGRDTLGEACLLAFTHGVLKTTGIGVFAAIFAFREQLMFPDVPVMRCWREARRLAHRVDGLIEADWRDLFIEPLEDVRAQLNISTPTHYRSVSENLLERDKKRRQVLLGALARGIDPQESGFSAQPPV